MLSCWHADPVERPDFTKVKEMLEKLVDKLSDRRGIIYINTTVSEEEDEEQLAQMPSEGPVLTSSPSCSRQTIDTSIVTVDVHESSAADEDERYVIVVPSENSSAVGQSSAVDAPLLDAVNLEQDTIDSTGDVTELHQVSSETTHLL